MSIQAFAPHDLPLLDPSTYVPHDLHIGQRAWSESNCYIDVWIEVLHALGLDPHACLPFVFCVDWEDDQWTFFKPPHEDLVTLYGVEVQELNVWRPLIENAEHQLRGGKVVLSEADAFFLPDTQGTDYRAQHTKTTIGMQAIDVAGQVLDYFHNSSYHRLSGDDFAGLFRLNRPPDPTYMPFFAEYVRLDRIRRVEPQQLLHDSLDLLRKHLGRRPRTNPIARWQKHFSADVEWLQTAGLATYHAYAFATVRQLGAAFEFGALYLRWLSEHGRVGFAPAAEDFNEISATCKSLILKMARAVNTKKPVDFGPMMTILETRWANGMDRILSLSA